MGSRWRVSAVALLVGLTVTTPALAADPPGSQPVLPLVDTVTDAAPYVVAPTLAPATGALSHRPARLLLHGTVVTMDDAHAVLPDGHVLVVGDRVAAVWSGSQPPRGVDTRRATTVETGPDGLIFPGLINLHDHPTYDTLPLWLPPRSHVEASLGRPTGAEPYANRYQWNRAGATSPPELARLVQNAQDVVTSDDALGLYVDAVKHAEARAILSGETAMEGEGDGDAALDGVLVRNVEGVNFGHDRVESRVPGVEDPAFAGDAPGLRTRMFANKVDAWFVHLGEGVRDGDRRRGDTTSSRHELTRIRDLGVLTDATVVIHGVGLERADFTAMRNAPPVGSSGAGLGAKLVWSPLSNLLLYGRTAHVYDAMAEGVVVSLGTDWTPSGSNSLLGELKIADIALHDGRLLGRSRHLVPSLARDEALDRALVDMVTRNPARTLRWPEVGTIRPGAVADLLVLQRPAGSPTGGATPSPYRSLIDATERDVDLTLVGGDPRAGDVGLMQALRGNDLEILRSARGDFSRAIDVTEPAVPYGGVTIGQVESRLTAALGGLGNVTYLRQHFAGGRYALVADDVFRDQVLIPRYGAVHGRPNLEPIALHPLLSVDDHFLFSVLATRTDPRPPYRLYPSNANFVTAGGNPFAFADYEGRWFARPSRL